MSMSDKTITEVLQSSSIVLIDDTGLDMYGGQHQVVSFYNDNDEKLADIIINIAQTGLLISQIIEKYDKVSVYQPDLSNLLVPSKQQLYKDLNL